MAKTSKSALVSETAVLTRPFWAGANAAAEPASAARTASFIIVLLLLVIAMSVEKARACKHKTVFLACGHVDVAVVQKDSAQDHVCTINKRGDARNATSL